KGEHPSKHPNRYGHLIMPSSAKPPGVRLVSLLVSSTEEQHSWPKDGRMASSYIAVDGGCQAKLVIYKGTYKVHHSNSLEGGYINNTRRLGLRYRIGATAILTAIGVS
ncbi:MAG: hypothetical protein JWN63_2352, partial [Candidatus Acidoferrum typicum]|nr:hypothetical protein [Candidatus Acidoferrum typicum]